MTDKEFRRLKRSQLIDIIYHLEKELEQQKNQIEELQKQLDDRTIRIQNAGSIANAALELNQIFETAQAAADQYTNSVEAEVERIKAEARENAAEEAEKIKKAAEEEAEQIKKAAEEEAEQIKKSAENKPETELENTEEKISTQEGE